MQKEKNPENATKLWSNLAGVTGSHIDALAAQDGMHDQLNSWFNFTALTDPPIVQHILDYTQARRPPQPDPRRQCAKTPAVPAFKSVHAARALYAYLFPRGRSMLQFLRHADKCIG